MSNRLTEVLILLFFAVPLTVRADPAILSGKFLGNEMTSNSYLTHCTGFDKIYQAVGPIQVETAGVYEFRDASINWDVDVQVSVYQGGFDPQNPNSGRVSTYDDDGNYNLQAGTDYTVVVQPLCENLPGVWAITFWGPGDLSGEGVVPSPAHWFGTFDGSEPLTDTTPVDYCSPSYYEQNGPLQVPASGTYYFSPLWTGSGQFGLQFAVYENSFDAANPSVNRIASVAFPAQIELEAGQDYIFVTQPVCEPDTGDWLYVLAPPAQFEITPGLNGAWFNGDTPGQGFLIDVLPDAGIVFYAEFAWDTSLPPVDATSVIGNAGNRWLTAQGGYSPGDQSITMPAYFASGGLYNDPAEVMNVESGTITLDFSDGCEGGMRSYEFAGGATGQTPFARLANDNLDLCIQQYEGPGVITQ